MKLIHFVSPDQVTGYASGLIIEGYRRSTYKGWPTIPRWYKRIGAVTLLLHVTIGKPRLFEVDFRNRVITARPMYWLRLTYYWPDRLRDAWKLHRLFECCRGVNPDDR